MEKVKKKALQSLPVVELLEMGSVMAWQQLYCLPMVELEFW